MTSYLTPDADRILTDYSITIERVVSGKLPDRQSLTPGVVVPQLVLTVFGGDVTVGGVLIHSRDNNREPIKDGSQYLLFLMKARSQTVGRYEIYYGGVFELLQERARPLLRDAKRVFDDLTDTPLNDLIARIEKTSPVR